METLILVCVIALLLFSMILLILSRYKKCPSDKVMVIYGKVGSNKDGSARSAKCIHGGAAFVWPVIQAREFLDLTPLSISVDLENALSRQNIRINVPSRFTVGISTEPAVMQNAAERLLGLKLEEVQELAKDIIFGQLRLVIATMDIEEINTDRDKFLEAVSRNVEGELKKIGLRLINVNVTDISDESGYIAALGKEAAAKAINDAKKSVAEKDRDGSIGEANAHRDQRVQVAQADSEAIKGENSAKMAVAMSNAARREKEAEALKIATSAEKIQAAVLWKRPTPPSSRPKWPVLPVKRPPRKPISSSRPRSKSGSWSWKPKPRPSRSAGRPKAKLTPSWPRCRPKPPVCRPCSPSRPMVCGRSCRPPAAIPMPLCVCCWPTRWKNCCVSRWKR